jgi:hypothetical protein
VPFGQHDSQAVEEEVRRTRRGRRGRGTRCRCHPESRTVGEPAGELGGHHRFQIGLPRERHVEQFQVPGRAEQQRGSVAATVRCECDLGAKQLRLRELQLVQRPHLRAGQ